jgi:uncharacterized OB-fold protein
MKRELKRSRKFTEVQEELRSSGAAIFTDAEGKESLYVLSPYHIDYVHSYAEDTPFFLGLSEGRLRGTRCPSCPYVFATPRGHCQFCGEPTEWVDLPLKGKVHAWTTCHFGSEAFLKETPYNLVLVEFEGVNSLFFSRLKDCTEKDIFVGMPVEARFADPAKLSVTDVWFVPTKPR